MKTAIKLKNVQGTPFFQHARFLDDDGGNSRQVSSNWLCPFWTLPALFAATKTFFPIVHVLRELTSHD